MREFTLLEAMGDAEALDVSLWVISDFLSGLVEGTGVHIHLVKDVANETQFDDSIIRGTKGECTCDDGDGC